MGHSPTQRESYSVACSQTGIGHAHISNHADFSVASMWQGYLTAFAKQTGAGQCLRGALGQQGLLAQAQPRREAQ